VLRLSFPPRDGLASFRQRRCSLKLDGAVFTAMDAELLPQSREVNRIGLADEGIYNGVCPRSPQALRERSASWKFKRLQQRRAQIEGRVSIIKNVFLSGRVRSKGFEHRASTVTWTVLVHNLWVLARLQRAEAARRAADAERKAA